MDRVVLIGCGKSKLTQAAPACELYTGALFRLSWSYAEQMQPASIFILSAKHGLVSPDQVLEPYDLTLTGQRATVRKLWATMVIDQLDQQLSRSSAQFVILAGRSYRDYLVPHLEYWEAPMAGLGIGQQLQFLKKAIPRP